MLNNMKYTIDESRNWYNALPSKRSSAAVIIRFEDLVLMVKDDYKDALTFPGGVIDPGESPTQAALRETAEEVGLVLDPRMVDFYSTGYIPETNGFLDRYHFFFIVTIGQEQKQAVQPDDGIEYSEWVPLTEIGAKAGGRPTYTALQHMLTSGQAVPYFEVNKDREGGAPWRT